MSAERANISRRESGQTNRCRIRYAAIAHVRSDACATQYRGEHFHEHAETVALVAGSLERAAKRSEASARDDLLRLGAWHSVAVDAPAER